MKDRKWPGTWMAFGIFFGLFTMVLVGLRTVVDVWLLVRGLALFCVVGALLPYAHSGLRMGMARLEWSFFNLFAIGPILMGVLLWVNLYIHGPEECHRFRVVDAAVFELPEGAGRIEVPTGEGWMLIRGDATGAEHYEVCVAKGCLGFWAITQRRYLPPPER